MEEEKEISDTDLLKAETIPSSRKLPSRQPPTAEDVRITLERVQLTNAMHEWNQMYGSNYVDLEDFIIGSKTDYQRHRDDITFEKDYDILRNESFKIKTNIHNRRQL